MSFLQTRIQGLKHTSFTVKPPKLWAMKSEGTAAAASSMYNDAELNTDGERRLVTVRNSLRNNLPSSSRLCVDSFPSNLVLDP